MCACRSCRRILSEAPAGERVPARLVLAGRPYQGHGRVMPGKPSALICCRTGRRLVGLDGRGVSGVSFSLPVVLTRRLFITAGNLRTLGWREFPLDQLRVAVSLLDERLSELAQGRGDPVELGSDSAAVRRPVLGKPGAVISGGPLLAQLGPGAVECGRDALLAPYGERAARQAPRRHVDAAAP